MAAHLTVSSEKLRELCARRGDPVISSVYLDVDGAHRPVAATYEDAFERLAEQLRRRAHGTADRGIIRSVDADVEHMRGWIDRGIGREFTHGLALFSCDGQGYFEAVEVAVPVRDEEGFGPAPMVRQLVEVLDEPEPFLVALIDRTHLRLIEVDDHHIVEHPPVITPHERMVDTSVELGSWEHHDEEAVRRHVRRAADALNEAMRTDPAGQIILGGPDEALAEFERRLDAGVAARVVGRVGISVAADAEKVASAARPIAEQAERRRERELVEELRQRAAGDYGGVVGLEPTLDALGERRVATLLVRDGFIAPGAVCPSCGHIGADVRQCPICGATNTEFEDIVEVAIERAITQSADVEFCKDTELERFGSIAALLRY